MTSVVSTNTQAILLLTAPLIVGRRGYSSELLTPKEYNQLERILRDNQSEPADLLGPDAERIFTKLQNAIDSERLSRLLGRGFLLSQAIDHWQARTIWVVSREDEGYPTRLKTRLTEKAPPVLYGCGDASILETGGLAIVGSRHVDAQLIEYTESVGRLAAEAGQTVFSGGARGIDQAALRGALLGGGRAAGVLADSLERLALTREHREYLMDQRLILVSPYDPAAGFDVGNAMSRNKAIYALADAALVVSSDYEKGGTWAGAVEQLRKLQIVPVYVRSNGEVQKGLGALQKMGAVPWPNPTNTEEFKQALRVQPEFVKDASRQGSLPIPIINQQVATGHAKMAIQAVPFPGWTVPPVTSVEGRFAGAKELILQMKTPKTEAEVAIDLQVSNNQARKWLVRLVKEGMLERTGRSPFRYSVPSEKAM